MNRVTRSLLLVSLSISVYLLTLGYFYVVTNPVAAVVSGSNGETWSKVFTVKERNWDVTLDYFRAETIGWNLRIEVYTVGKNDLPVFSTSAVRIVYPDGYEGAELNAHLSLPEGRYYLKIYSTNVHWTIRVLEWA